MKDASGDPNPKTFDDPIDDLGSNSVGDSLKCCVSELRVTGSHIEGGSMTMGGTPSYHQFLDGPHGYGTPQIQ